MLTELDVDLGGGRTLHAYDAPPDDAEFTADDEAALVGRWAWMLTVVRAANASNSGGPTDDEVAFAAPWGFDSAEAALEWLHERATTPWRHR